jgi:hypothetical protein
MENKKIKAVIYSELGEGDTVVCVLDPSVDAEKYVKQMNDDIPEFNKDVDIINSKISELREKYRLNESFESITGEPLLNEREPKYPAQKPAGFKSVQVACPEITLERERRRLVNEKNREIYNKFMNEARSNLEKEIEPLNQALIAKWPKFKAWTKSSYYYSSRRIYETFYLNTFNYISE